MYFFFFRNERKFEPMFDQKNKRKLRMFILYSNTVIWSVSFGGIRKTFIIYASRQHTFKSFTFAGGYKFRESINKNSTKDSFVYGLVLLPISLFKNVTMPASSFWIFCENVFVHWYSTGQPYGQCINKSKKLHREQRIICGCELAFYSERKPHEKQSLLI